MTKQPLVNRVGRILTDNQLLLPESRVITGVSGGVDSVALLYLLAALADSLRISPVAVYVDHGLRPDETGAEARLVAGHAARLGLNHEICRVDSAAHAREKKLSPEHAARELRYSCLRRCAEKYDAPRIAVAHTADDQAEEVLLRLLRGAGGKGLAGMSLINGDIIRPLLPIRKEELRDYLQVHGIPFCEDSSNRNLCFTRNRVRHLLLPFLERRFGPNIRRALIKSADNLAADEELLRELTEQALRQTVRQPEREEEGEGNIPVCRILRQRFRRLPAALQRRVVEKVLWRMKSPARYVHIIDIIAAIDRGRTGTELHLSRGLRLGILRDTAEFSHPRGRRAWRGRLFETEERKQQE